jgi:hypothetical protein
VLGHDAEGLLPKNNEIIIRPTDLATESFLGRRVSRSKRSRTIFSPAEFPRAWIILYVFVAGGTKLICAMTSEVGCFSLPRNPLYSRITS